jgi:hypothetical protein
MWVILSCRAMAHDTPTLDLVVGVSTGQIPDLKAQRGNEE